MRLRNALILLGVAAALVLFIFLFEQHSPSTEDRLARERLAFPGFGERKGSADAIEIERGSERIVIVRRDAGRPGERWQITKPLDYRAATSSVVSFFGAFERAEKAKIERDRREIPLEPASDLSQYGLDQDSAVRVRVSAGDDKLLDCLVGQKTATGDRVYVTTAERRAVYALDVAVREEALKRVDDFRDKRLVDLTRGEATYLALHEGGETVAELSRERKGPWRVVSPVADRANQERVDGVVEGMGSLWAEKFAADFAPGDPEMPRRLRDYELRPPRRRVVLTLEVEDEPRRIEVLFGKRIAKTVSGERAWDVAATVAGSRAVVYLPEEAVDLLKVEADDLRDPNVARFEVPDVRTVRIDRPWGRLELARREEGWELASPEARRAEPDAVLDLLEALKDLRVTEFLPGDLPLRDPVVRVELAFGAEEPAADGGGAGGEEVKPQSPEIVFFEAGEREPASVRARRGPGGAVFLVSSGILDDIGSPPHRFWRKKVLEFDDRKLEALTLRADGRTEAAVREAGDWKALGEAEVDRVAADNVKWDLADLEAEEFVGKASAEDLSRFGLALPAIRAEAVVGPGVEGGGEGVHVLLVGKQAPAAEGEATRHYAMLEETGEVFLVGGSVVENLRKGLFRK
jgi:hypothetical protein